MFKTTNETYGGFNTIYKNTKGTAESKIYLSNDKKYVLIEFKCPNDETRKGYNNEAFCEIVYKNEINLSDSSDENTFENLLTETYSAINEKKELPFETERHYVMGTMRW